MELFGIDATVLGDAVFADNDIDADRDAVRGSIFEDMIEGRYLRIRLDSLATSSKTKRGVIS